jgi:preprotein translocase subunit SecE
VQFLSEFIPVIMDYIKRSMKELTEEVTWPTWGELQKTTVVVIAGSVFLACLVALMDVIWVNVLGLLY